MCATSCFSFTQSSKPGIRAAVSANMRVFYAIGLLLLINGQVNSLPTTLGEEDIVSKFVEWLDKNVEAFIKEGTESTAQVKPFLETATADGQVNIEKSTTEAYQRRIQKLKILRKASAAEFLQCDRLNEGLENIAQMLKETFNITVDVGQLVKDVATNLASCSTALPFVVPFCVGKYALEFGNKIKELVPVLELYKLDIVKLASEIKEIYNYCSTK